MSEIGQFPHPANPARQGSMRPSPLRFPRHSNYQNGHELCLVPRALSEPQVERGSKILQGCNAKLGIAASLLKGELLGWPHRAFCVDGSTSKSRRGRGQEVATPRSGGQVWDYYW